MQPFLEGIYLKHSGSFIDVLTFWLLLEITSKKELLIYI